MKRTLALLLATVLAVGLVTYVSAQMAASPAPPANPAPPPPAPTMACPMHAACMQSMMQCSLVATSDGGVAVIAGGKLLKYDRDLNLTKQIDLPIDVEAMQKRMTDTMKACPMCQGMMASMRAGRTAGGMGGASGGMGGMMPPGQMRPGMGGMMGGGMPPEPTPPPPPAQPR